ncbi:MAG TPA: cytochrome c [Gemmatimonadaceae bacterium]|nr:cytochrome c [Gemmatimonadaceae bacterium]
MSGNWSRLRAARGMGSVALACAVLTLGACDWFTTFKHQPRVEPWETEYFGTDTIGFPSNPEMSVPIRGGGVPALVVSHAPNPATIDSMASLPNPTPPTERSLANGRKYFQINCSVCHGLAGAGDGTAVKFGVPAPSLMTDRAKGLADGYIYGIIRNGRGLMPTYDRIQSADRWDVVNYIRGLQGKLSVSVPTGPVGSPGETGATVPGATTTAPTLPAPYVHPGADVGTFAPPADSAARGGGARQ